MPKKNILAELPQELKRIKNITLDKKYFGAMAVKIEERSNLALFLREGRLRLRRRERICF